MDKHPDRIAEQAAMYFAQRRGSTLPERRTRDAWIREDVEHAQAYSRCQRLWEHTGTLADDSDLQALKAQDLLKIRKRRRIRPQRLLAVAALLVAMVGTAYLVNPLINPPPIPVSYATELGERRTETLADGTEIVLNTNSALQVQYADNRRDIVLQHGEAQFEVAHDVTRPFVVRVDKDTVTAIGTRFQVRKEADNTVITLFEGVVEVSRGNERYTLRPNERAILSNRMGVSIIPIDPLLASGWLDGWLRFRSTPLGEVIAEANRYSEPRLRLGDPRLANIEFSGNFHAGDNPSIADAVAIILRLRVERRDGEIVLLPK